MNLSAKDLDFLTHLLIAEEIAAKKARIYANTLLDTVLADAMNASAEEHEKRFHLLLGLLNGGVA